MKALNSFMSWLGYVPRSSTSLGSLTFEINVDSASVDAAIVELERMRVTAQAAEQAIGGLDEALVPVAARFAAELAADETRPLILAELRKQTTMLEVLAKQGDFSIGTGRMSTLSIRGRQEGLDTGADASGLPG